MKTNYFLAIELPEPVGTCLFGRTSFSYNVENLYPWSDEKLYILANMYFLSYRSFRLHHMYMYFAELVNVSNDLGIVMERVRAYANLKIQNHDNW